MSWKAPFVRTALAAVAVTLLIGARVEAATAAAGTNHTVVIANGEVWTWGRNAEGQLGDGTTIARPLPVKVQSIVSAIAVAAGANHTLVLKADGTMLAWGQNNYGQLGNGTTTNQSVPVVVTGLGGPVTAIAAGDGFSLALRADGTILSWGDNASGQLGTGNTTPRLTPGAVIVVTGAVSIAAGRSHGLAAKSDGTPYAWGLNYFGQLGDGTTTNRTTPTQVPGVSGIVRVGAGRENSFFVESDGSALACGNNSFGQLGDGSALNKTTPVRVAGVYGSTLFSGSALHSIALLDDGTVWGWGRNEFGELGDGTTVPAMVAIAVGDLAGVVTVASGGSGQNVAITADQTVWAWGRNDQGQIGDGTFADRHVPVKISESFFNWKTGTPIFSVPTAEYSTDKTLVLSCATPGAVIRYTTNGTEPNAISPTYSTPLAINSISLIKAKAFATSIPESNTETGSYNMTVARPVFNPVGGVHTTSKNVAMTTTTPSATIRYTTNGSEPTGSSTLYTGPVLVNTQTTLKAVGFRTNWNQSRTTVDTYSFNYGALAAPTASPVAGSYTGSVVVNLSAVAGATIRYTTDGSDPTTTSPTYSSPVTISATTTLKARAWKLDWSVSPASSTAYTVVATAPTFTPGGGTYSLGQTITLLCSTPAATIRYTLDGSEPTTNDPGVPSGTSIFARTFTLKAKAWATGLDPSTTTTAAYTVSGTAGAGNVAAGESHSVVLTSSGTVWSWGANGNGQVGDGTSVGPKYEPKQITGLTTVVAISAGSNHSLALKADGTVWAWGRNASGQIGDGTAGTDRLSPVQVTGLTGVIKIAAGNNHSMAVKGDGTLWVWGSNVSGQVGDGTTTQRNSPTQITGFSNVVGVAAGGSHSLAAKQDGTVYGWGLNSNGQVGDGTLTSPRLSPVLVSGLSGITAVAAGQTHSVARMTDGTTWAWGYNLYSQLGNNSSVWNSATPVEVWGVSGALEPRAGGLGDFSLALQSDGVVRGWGYNAWGQLGIGTMITSPVAVPVVGLPQIVAVSAGKGHSLALAQNGSVWGWGLNTSGQIGDGTVDSRPLPVKISEAAFAWKAATPVISPSPEVIYTQPPNVSFTTNTAGGTIRYTTDGSEPTGASPAYSAPFALTSTSVVRAKTMKAGLSDSNTAVASYTLKVANPGLTPGGGTYGSPQTVTVNCITPSVTLRYTTNGQEPTTSDATVAAGGTIAVNAPLTLKVKGWRTGWTTSDTTSAQYILRAVDPVLSPAGGSFAAATSVTISTTTAGATIRYTTNGQEPTEASTSIASGSSVLIGQSTTLKAKAFRAQWQASATISGSYALSLGTAGTPTFSPAAGTYATAQTVVISATSADVIRYSTDGSDPSSSSPIYAKPLVVAAPTTLKAKAYRPDRAPSAIGTAAYTINSGAVAAPALSVASGYYTTTRTVVITDATAGATIRYTTNGNDPTTSDTVIASGSSITVDRSMIVKATAWKTGMTTSPVTRRDYVITGAVAAGQYHSLALKGNGTVYGWGGNSYGEVGDGTTGTNRLTPTQVTTLTNVVAIAVGANHSLALKSDGTVFGWGANSSGQVGDGTTTNRSAPVQVGITGNWLTGVVAIAAGDVYSLAIKSDGSAWAWGSNYWGQLGDGTSGNTRTTPVRIGVTGSWLSGVTTLAGGDLHTLALKSDGSVMAWGYNYPGRLGDGTTTQRLTPVPVINLSGVTAIAAGSNFSMAVSDGYPTGSLWAWGANDEAQLGDSTTLARMSPARGPTGLSIAASRTQAWAIGADGSTWGWGANGSGELGIGIITTREATPKRISLAGELSAISSRFAHVVGLVADGTVRSWGTNSYGQLGNGTQTNALEPKPVPGFSLVSNAWMLEDTDADGLPNAAEYRLGSDPLVADTNGDGVRDGAAVLSGRSVTSPDTDLDGLSNSDELRLGTDSLRADSDADGTADGADCYPLDATRTTCGTPNPSDVTGPVITLTEPANVVPLP